MEGHESGRKAALPENDQGTIDNARKVHDSPTQQDQKEAIPHFDTAATASAIVDVVRGLEKISSNIAKLVEEVCKNQAFSEDEIGAVKNLLAKLKEQQQEVCNVQHSSKEEIGAVKATLDVLTKQKTLKDVLSDRDAHIEHFFAVKSQDQAQGQPVMASAQQSLTTPEPFNTHLESIMTLKDEHLKSLVQAAVESDRTRREGEERSEAKRAFTLTSMLAAIAWVRNSIVWFWLEVARLLAARVLPSSKKEGSAWWFWTHVLIALGYLAILYLTWYVSVGKLWHKKQARNNC